AEGRGRTRTIGRVPFTIVGVMPPSFFGPSVGRAADLVIPIGCEPLIRGPKESMLDRRSTWWLTIMLRLKPSQSIEQATQALRSEQPRIREATLPPDWPAKELPTYLNEAFVLTPASSGFSPLPDRYARPLLPIIADV